MKSVAIIVGWAEGPWQAKSLEKALVARGFQITADATTADIILTHSAGCYFVPKDAKAQLIVMICIPFWPGRSILRRVWTNAVQELHYYADQHNRQRGVAKLLHNVWYVVTQPVLNLRRARAVLGHNFQTLPRGRDRSIIVVRPALDAFCTPDIMEVLPSDIAQDYTFKEMPGLHEGCWGEPEPYVELVEEYVKARTGV